MNFIFLVEKFFLFILWGVRFLGTPPDRLSSWPVIYYDQGIFRGSFHIVCIGINIEPYWWSGSGRMVILHKYHLLRSTSLYGLCFFVVISGFFIDSFLLNTKYETWPTTVKISEMIGVQPKSRFANCLVCINALEVQNVIKVFDCQTLERFSNCNLKYLSVLDINS